MSDEPKPGFTRRDMVRGALVGVVAARVGSQGKEPTNATLGPGAVPVELQVNGKLHRLSLEPRIILAEALRERLGLTGTKVVCGRGACGACTVTIDGETVCSCLLLAAEVQGKSITTIEGLASDDRLTPIQQAFVEADALQCGFCTSGMIMSCKALLDRHPKPSREQIVHAVSGNLCRCGTYPHVFQAVERAAGLKTAAVSASDLQLRLAPLVSRLTSDGRVDQATTEALEEA